MKLRMIKVQKKSNGNPMVRYCQVKRTKGSDKAIIATARRQESGVWTLLTEEKKCDGAVMNGAALIHIAQEMSNKVLGYDRLRFSGSRLPSA